jgi:hypothetical protein
MDVRLPNGVIMTNVPEGTSKDEIRAKAIRNGLASGADFGEQSDIVAQIPTGGAVSPTVQEPVQPRSVLDAALMGAAAVPPLAAGARALQALTAGSRAAPYVANLAKAVVPQTGTQLVREGLLGAASGAAGEMVARQVPEQYGQLGEVVGGILGGVAAGGAMGSISNMRTATQNAGGLFSSTKDLANQIAQVAGAGKASMQALTALKANPNLAGNVARAAEIETSTGVSLPMLAAANGDTTISSYLQSQIAKGDNSEFTASLKRQYEIAEQQLSSIKGRLAPTAQEVDAYVKRKAKEAAEKNAEAVAAAAKASARREAGLENIDARIQELSASLSTGVRQEDIGNRLTNLLAAKESALKKEIGPKYEELIKNSEEAGIVLPGSSAQGLRDYVLDTKRQDIFNSFPKLFGTIQQVFKPKQAASSRIQEKYRIAKEAGTMPDFSLRSLDSLKRETNEALRQTQRGTDQYRILMELKNQVDTAIDSVDPAFSAPYRAIDKEYATRIGMPFNEAGVVQIDRSKFVEQTVPKLTKTASGLKDALAIIGDSPEGLKIVEDAFMFDIAQNRSIINTNTGELNPAQLRRYIAQNKDKIDLVPGLRERLEGIGGRVNELRQNRTAILNAEKQASVEKIENLWTQAYGTSGGIQGLVRDALSNPQKLDQLLDVAGKDAVARKGIQTAMLEDLLSAGGDRMALLANNKAAIDKVFGKGQAKLLTDVVEASQRLKDNPFAMRININTISKSKLEEITGTKGSTTAGELRNQVMSAPRVFINHLSRFFQKTADEAEAAEVQKFLLNPKALEQASKFMAEVETRGFSDRALNLFGTLMKNSASNWLFGGLAGGIVGAQEREKQGNTYDPAMLEGFTGVQ